MKHFTKPRSLMAMTLCLCFVLLSGCKDQVLDFRNAEIVHGKVYQQGSNEPFTGHVTNVDFGALQPIQPGLKLFNNDMFSLFPVQKHGFYFGVFFCDVSVKKGYMEGDGVCFVKQNDKVTLKFSAKGGLFDGPIEIFSADNPDRLINKGTFKNGKIHGMREIYSPATGKLGMRSEWVNGDQTGDYAEYGEDGALHVKGTITRGIWDGVIEQFYPNGKLLRRGTWKLGQPAGEFKVYDEQGKLVIHQIVQGNVVEKDFLNTEPQKSLIGEALSGSANGNQPTTNPSDMMACVEHWTKAHRKQVGDAPISIAQLDEWEQWCKDGKLP